jgi:hypothetical protein
MIKLFYYKLLYKNQSHMIEFISNTYDRIQTHMIEFHTHETFLISS